MLRGENGEGDTEGDLLGVCTEEVSCFKGEKGV